MAIDATIQTNRTPLSALLAANVVSLVGSMLTLVALPWFVLQTTGSAAKAGLVGFAVFLPAFLAGIFGGALVDRLGYKRSSVLADTVSGLGIAAIPLLYHTVGLAFWQLLVLVFVGAMLKVPGLTARRAMLPELADLAGMRLEWVNASFESVQNLAMLAGPALAGLLVGLLGASNVLWFDAGSFFVSAVAVAAAIPSPPRVVRETAGRYVDQLLAGLRFLRRDNVLFSMAIALGIANGLTGSMFAVVLPVYADRAFGSATQLGIMVAAAGAGALAGSTLYGSVGYRLPRRLVWLAAYLIAPLEFWVIASEPTLAVAVAAIAVAGFVSGPLNPLMVTIRHERIPPDMRGRVFATYSAIAMAAQPLGMLAAGNLIEGAGFRPTVLLFAACLQALALAMLFVPAFRELERPSKPIEVDLRQ